MEGFPTLSELGPSERDPYGPEIFDALERLEDQGWWFHNRNELIAWAMRRYCPHASSFHEVGCGTGVVLRAVAAALPDAAISASDPFAEGLRIAAGRVPRAKLWRADAARLPFRDAFDVVGAFDVIEHVEADADVLESIAMALKPSGHLLLTVPQHPALWSRQDDLAHHQRRYTQVGLRARLGRARLEPRLVTSFVTLLLPALVASRFMPRKRVVADVTEMLESPQWMERPLRAVSASSGRSSSGVFVYRSAVPS